MMLGPTLEAVHAWLSIDPSDTYSDYTANPEYTASNPSINNPHTSTSSTTYTDADHFRAIPGAAPTGPAELTSLFANLTLGLWNSVVGGVAGGSSGAMNSNSAQSRDNKGPVVPAEAFTGIVMHYFIDSQQVNELFFLSFCLPIFKVSQILLFPFSTRICASALMIVLPQRLSPPPVPLYLHS